LIYFLEMFRRDEESGVRRAVEIADFSAAWLREAVPASRIRVGQRAGICAGCGNVDGESARPASVILATDPVGVDSRGRAFIVRCRESGGIGGVAPADFSDSTITLHSLKNVD
jgi:hypothetical protein